MKIGEIMHLKEGPEDCISIKCGINGTEEMSCFETPKPTMGAMVLNEKTIYIATSSMLMRSTPFSTPGEESIRVSNISVSNNFGQSMTLSTKHKTSSFSETFPAPVITKVPTKRAIADSIVALSRPSGLSLSTSKTAETIKPLEIFSKSSTHLETSKVTQLRSSPIISPVTTKVDVLTSQLSTVPPTLNLSSSTLSSTGPTITSIKVKEVSNRLIPTKELSETTTYQTTVQPSGRVAATPETTPSIVSLDKTRIQKLNQYSKQAIYRNNCLNATCYENGTFYISTLQCPQVEAIICKYGIPPMKVYDQDGCCFHYKCPSCMGTNGTEKNPGETWIDNCQNCYCDKTLVKIFCSPVTCPPLNFSLCKKPWNPYPILNKEDHCCPKIECRCDPSQCTYPTLSCQLGYETVLKIPKGECCMRLKCKPMNVCIVNGTVYQVGKLIWTETSPCQTCRCSNIKDSQTGFNTITCTPIICIKNCSLGFVYEEASTGCCGMCVQVSCVVTTSNGSLFTLQPGNSVSDNCTQYTCERVGNSLVTSAQTQICPLLHKEDCESGQYMKTPDGCCNICKAPNLCMIESKLTEISQNGCSAKVHLSYCKGSCWSLSEFSNSSLQMEGKCKCCKEIGTVQNVIELTCLGEKNKNITVTSAKSCACTSVKCIP